MPCLNLTSTIHKKIYKILIDTGATHNYINRKCDSSEKIKIKPIKIKTMHGYSMVDTKKVVRILKKNITFFELEDIQSFDMILGYEGLKVLNAEINFSNMTLTTISSVESIQKINYIIGENNIYKADIDRLMKINNSIGPLPFTDTIEASIRTTNDNPVYVKQYPYPIADNEFVNKEIQKLLHDDIIEKSHSPYNSPIWTVPKKGLDEKGKPKRRMVVDFQKLNAHTVTDRYPIPDVNMTIQNLGKAKYFTTLDLESGFHQIKIKTDDKEKTAFAINGAKYQFKRMPFGLKNAPSIFQRCVDDILRDFVGKFVHVYIDDVLIYSSSEEEHIQHISQVFDVLNKATLKISDEKSKFFQEEVEYLGHIIRHGRITTNPEKIAAIENFPVPQTVKDLRGFLGLTGYYRKFIKGYASIAKPLTLYLRGDNGKVNKKQSKNIKLNLNDSALEAIRILKNYLKEQVELFQPDYSKPFELTTDASNIAIGAVLSQNKQPIHFLSRTLSKTEENYSTNEKELLAIIWSLQKLRNYIYGIADLTIYTDHQSLIYSVSEKNPNTKLKRWKGIIEDFGAKLVYKPGNLNLVADALSRQRINTSTIETAHSAESSSNDIIKTVNQPFNAYTAQFELIEDITNNIETQIYFGNKIRLIIKFKDKDSLLRQMKEVIQPQKIVALHTKFENIYKYGENIKKEFPLVRFIFTPRKLQDVTNLEEQLKLVRVTHERAHRGLRNNIQEISEKYYWPDLNKQAKSFNKKCIACLFGKYERKPIREPLNNSEIPTHVGTHIHMDIYFNDKYTFLVTVDKYSKYTILREIETRNRLYDVMEEVLSNYFPKCERLMTDNEKGFKTEMVNQMCLKYNITKVETPVYRSTANGQVERVNGTITELSRIFTIQNKTRLIEEIFRTVRELNNSIHSVTGLKPRDIFFNQNKYRNSEIIINKLNSASKKVIERLNKGTRHREYKKGDKIMVRITGLRKKSNARYITRIVEEDKGDTVISKEGIKIHKDNIKNYHFSDDENINIPNITRNCTESRRARKRSNN